MRRVAVTGYGLHGPFGDDAVGMFDALLADRTATVAMPEWAQVADLGPHVAAPVPDFDGKHLPRKVRRTMGKVALFGASASDRAIRHAGLEPADVAGEATAVVMGSSAGSGASELEFWQHFLTTNSARGVRSTTFFEAMAHTVATNVALLLGVTGEVFSVNCACASSNQAIGVGAERIRLGKADVVLAGGAEELHVTAGVIFHSVLAASTGFNDRPRETPRPFDAARDGIVVGEGGAVLVLEEWERAKARGATIHAEVLGFGTSCDAVNMANPEPEGMRTAMARALKDAGLPPSAVSYVNAHATGTRAGDAAEAEAVWRLLGGNVPTSSNKGHLGHTLGACGA
ncbi:MAG: beta-ketoacyl-ACP synthase, partial [Myxococcales bacterium]|nr:beta-ketoacyl-ACP synthase [Myxococcales bacterium]